MVNAPFSPASSRRGIAWLGAGALLALMPAAPSGAAPGSVPVPASLASQQVIKACGQIAEWPPYTFYRRDFGVRTEELMGYSVEMLKKILDRKHLLLNLDLIPWKRCMAAVESGLYDMMVDVSSNEQRARLYLVSQPYYTLHMAYFYDMDQPAPSIHELADLQKYRLCGVRSYNYAPFGLSDQDVDMGSLSLAQAFVKLKHKRCDVVPDRLEIALGYKFINVVDMNSLNIGYGLIPGVPPVPFRMMVSRRVPYGPELLHVLDEGISALLASGEAKTVSDKYAIQGLQIGLDKALPGDK